MNNKQVAELFIEQNVLQPSQVDDVLNEAELNGKTIAQAMVDSGFVDEHGFYQTIAEGLGTEYVDLSEREIPPEILRLIPSGLARLPEIELTLMISPSWRSRIWGRTACMQ